MILFTFHPVGEMNETIHSKQALSQSIDYMLKYSAG